MSKRIAAAGLALVLAAVPALAQEATPEVTPESTPEIAASIPFYRPRVLEQYPHSTSDFTQGLVWSEGRIFQSAGRYAESRVQELTLEDAAALREQPLADEYFAEGLALVDDRLIQITWREGTAFVYDRDSFEVIGQFSYEGEGWGLCYDGDSLWMSDGSPNLFQRDPDSFELLATVPVLLFDAPVSQLNELECVDGSVWANIWQTDYIVQIDPASGQVTAVVDATGLLPGQPVDAGAVLNGIAYISERDTYLITGKLWPVMFEVTWEQVGTLQPREGG